eukprot:Clim_evm29s242 gene=Clim_evmTU29s242
MPGATVKDVTPSEFITAYAAFLKQSGKMDVPAWAELCKTGVNKELAPYDRDWFYIRSAAVARHVYLKSKTGNPAGLGVGRISRIFGSTFRRGVRPEHFRAGSKSVARHSLHQLEKCGVVEKAPNGGRRVTAEGQRDMDRIATQVLNSRQ